MADHPQRLDRAGHAPRREPSTASATSCSSTCSALRVDRRARCAATCARSLRLLAEVSFGAGALAVIGGTVGVMVALSCSPARVVGLQGYAALNQLGTAALTGFISAYFNTREIAPLVAGLALSATVGCGFTAQLGAMRISEEIDALEVMGVPQLPYLVTTRIIAGFVAVIPLYVDRPADVATSRSRLVTVYVLRPVRAAPTTTTSPVPAAGRRAAGRSSRCWSSRSWSS